MLCHIKTNSAFFQRAVQNFQSICRRNINTPLIVPSINTPTNAPTKIKNSVRDTFHNLAASSNSVAPSNAEITIAVSTGTGRYLVITAPASIKRTANGTLGQIFLAASKIPRDANPKRSEGTLISESVFAICYTNSGNSPVPAVPPISFGNCIRMIVVQIPVINPPITGADI